jgi:hypothetical protein
MTMEGACQISPGSTCAVAPYTEADQAAFAADEAQDLAHAVGRLLNDRLATEGDLQAWLR